MTRKCKFCREPFEPTFTTMQETCDIPCAIGLATEKREQKETKVKKEKDKVFKQKWQTEDVGYQHKLTQKVFNRLRVLEEKILFRDQGIEPYCISCGKTGMLFSCGHLKTVGHQGNLRYDRKNTFLQCLVYCNKNLSGNIEGNKTTHGYKKGLILRFGEVKGQSIIDYCDTHTATVDWFWEDLKNFRAECSAKIRELEKLNSRIKGLLVLG